MKRIAILLGLSWFWWTQTTAAQTLPVATSPSSVTASPASSGILFVAHPDSIVSLDALLKPHQGRVVYLDFWGTWCVPCRREMPYSARLKEKLKGQPVDFIYVAYENGYSVALKKRWKAAVLKQQIKGYHFMMNPAFEGELGEHVEVDSYPRYVIVDKTGEIVTADAARPSETAEVLRQLRAALAQ